MAVKSIIEVAVDDGPFKRFAEMFARFQTAAKKTPETWRDTNKEIDRTADTVEEITEALDDQVNKGRERDRQLGREVKDTKAISDARKAVVGVESRWERQAQQFRERQVHAWRSMARDAKSFASHIAEATRSLLRWGALTGAISGLLGAGGLFGISRLASSAGTARRSALGLGVSVGEEKAFSTNYGRVVDTQHLLSGVNEALHDVTKRVSLYGAGLSESQLKGKNTAQVSDELIPALKKIADQTPEAMMAQVLQSRHLDQFVTLDEFQRLKNTPASELDEYHKNYARDRGSMNFTDQVGKAWQDLQVQLKRAGEQIETTFIKGLVPLAPQISKLSDSVTKVIGDLMASPQLRDFIDGLANGIKWLGDFLISDGFKRSLDGLLKWAGDIGDQAAAFSRQVSALVASTGDFEKTVREIVRFSTTLSKTIEESAQFIAKVLHFILDPWMKVGGSGGGTGERPFTKDEAEEWNKKNPTNPYKGGAFADNPDDKDWEFNHWSKEWRRKSASPPTFGFDTSTPRGIRNNNPLNLEYREGQGAVGTDGRFGVYDSMDKGVAAAHRQLVKYQDERGLDSLSKIIGRWAPASENDTAGYVKAVSDRTHIDPNAKVDMHDPKVAAAVIAAMAKRETGRDIDEASVQRGVGMSGGLSLASNTSRPGTPVNIFIHNNTGGNAVVSANQLAY